jgi:hypothetical protein
VRRPGRLVGWLTAAVLLGWGLSWGVPRAPGALARVDWFRVRSFRVEGARYLTAAEVESAAAVPAGANLWDDVAPVAARLRAHPLVRDVHIGRRLPGTLVVRVEERRPVGLLPTPTLEPVDREGRRLPLDPALHRLDLPVIRASRSGRGSSAPAAIAAAAREAARLAEADPGFWEGVSAITEEGARDLTVEWGDPAVRLRFRAPLAQTRLREAKAVLADVSDRGDPAPLLLDLRFADQVVVRWTETNRDRE